MNETTQELKSLLDNADQRNQEQEHVRRNFFSFNRISSLHRLENLTIR